MKLPISFSSKITFLICIFYFGFVTFILQRTPMIGIADNGDFGRVVSWVGIAPVNGENNSNLEYVNRYFNYTKITPGQMLSTQILFLYGAKIINNLINVQYFDLKIYGIIQTIIFSAGLFFLLKNIKKINSIIYTLFIPIVFIVFTDASYISYFNSFYQEGPGLIFLIIFLAVLTRVVGLKKTETTASALLCLFVSSLLLILAKPQYFVLSIPVVITMWLTFSQNIKKKKLVLFSFLIFSLSILYYFVGSSPIIKRWNAYNALFAQVLGSTTDQNRAQRVLGVETELLKYSGVPAYYSNSGVNDSEVDKYLGSPTLFKVLGYYIITPQELLNLSQKLAKVSFTTKIDFVGYYEKVSETRPLQQLNEFNWWTNFKENQLSNLSDYLIYFLLVNPIVWFVVFLKTKIKFFIIGEFISLAALSQFIIVLVSEGLFGVPPKHLFLYDVLFDLELFFCIGAILWSIELFLERVVWIKRLIPTHLNFAN
jgi:hypothetical protein